MLLIDADILVYRVGFAAQTAVYVVRLKGEEEALLASQLRGKAAVNLFLKEHELTEEEVVLDSFLAVDPLENALHSVIVMLESMQNRLNDHEVRLFLTGSTNFRYDVLPSYKSGRGDKPLLYQEIRDYLIDHWQAEVSIDEEADDALGKAQTTGTVICSIDKDLLMIPGDHYNFVTDTFVTISDHDGYFNYCSQLLSGDQVDSICGIRGIGKKTADKLLLKEPIEFITDYMGTVHKYYKKFWGEGWEEVLKCNEQLLWIRRE